MKGRPPTSASPNLRTKVSLLGLFSFGLRPNSSYTPPGDNKVFLDDRLNLRSREELFELLAVAAPGGPEDQEDIFVLFAGLCVHLGEDLIRFASLWATTPEQPINNRNATQILIFGMSQSYKSQPL